MMPVLSAGKRASRHKQYKHVIIADPCSKTSIIQPPVIQKLDNVIHQAPDVQNLDSAMHRINHYPVDNYQGNQLRYLVDRDLSVG